MSIQQVKTVFAGNNSVFATLSVSMFGIDVWRVDYVSRKYVTIEARGRKLSILPSYISGLSCV